MCIASPFATPDLHGQTVDHEHTLSIIANPASCGRCGGSAIMASPKHLTEFNKVLAANTDKRVKVSSVSVRDDFADIPAGKLIEFLRSAGVISNDVRKILDEKLGTRNSSAHPSAIAIKRSKVIAFVEDLVENVVLKYKV